MTRIPDMKQREAAMPTAAFVGPFMRDLRLGSGWAGIADSWVCQTSNSHGFTAKRSTRHLGRSST